MKFVVWSVLLCTVLCVYASPGIEFVQILTRHGARTPFTDVPNFPVTWNCKVNPLSIPQTGNASTLNDFQGRLYRKSYLNGRETLLGDCSTGQLTDVGLIQHYKLGQQFRQRYVDQFGLLSKELNTTELFIRSADVERCVQSAQSQLLGLYPPTHPNKPNVVDILPIYTIEQALDDVETGPRCPKLMHLCNQLQNSSSWISYLNQFNSFQASLIRAWNLTQNPKAMPSWDDIFDILESRVFDNQPLPPGINTPEVAKVSAIASGELARLWESTERVQLAIGQFMFEIYSRFTEKISMKQNKPIEANFGSFPKFPNFYLKDLNHMNQTKYLLYSAHDITCSLVLAALGIFDGNWPQFASHIQMELWRDGQEWFVGVLYNDKYMYLPGCHSQWLCPWAQVEKNLARVMIHSQKQYQDLCYVDHPVVPINGISEYIC